MEIIARIKTPFPEKFGIPRQSGLIAGVPGTIIFEPKYRQPEAFKGLSGFSHLWILWDFSLAHREEFAATVSPPRLGGKEKIGVFASRSPFRPNPIGMSVVKIEKIREDEKYGIVIDVSGVDMLKDTPVYDIKPYIPYSDMIPDAKDGFVGERPFKKLKVIIPDEISKKIPAGDIEIIKGLISLDPRTRYINDESRIWGMAYNEMNIRFKVSGDTAVITQADQLSLDSDITL